VIVSWAIHNGEVKATKKKILHSLWFDEIGLPSSGYRFDMVTRGTLQILEGSIRVDIYADAGNPNIALEYINTIIDRSGLSVDDRSVDVFIQGDCFSRKIL